MVQLTRRQSLLLLGAALPASDRWQQIAAETDGTLGAAALHLRSGQHLILHGGEPFPLASVCKLPAALHILALVDSGKLSRTEDIEVLHQDVTLNNSEVGHRWPKQRRFPLDELLLLMVAHSDNTAVETLYRIGGGAAAINARLRGWHLEGIRIDRTERQCNLDAARSMPGFIADPRDTATPEGTVLLLQRLFQGALLSAPSTARLVEILQATTTGAARIKGLLPAGTVVAHKTGTTGTERGLNGSTNDVGLITLPKGAGQLALAVYLKGSRRDLPAREMIIARIAKAAFDNSMVGQAVSPALPHSAK
jgi:beta-lactamase class A